MRATCSRGWSARAPAGRRAALHSRGKPDGTADVLRALDVLAAVAAVRGFWKENPSRGAPQLF